MEVKVYFKSDKRRIEKKLKQDRITKSKFKLSLCGRKELSEPNKNHWFLSKRKRFFKKTLRRFIVVFFQLSKNAILSQTVQRLRFISLNCNMID